MIEVIQPHVPVRLPCLSSNVMLPDIAALAIQFAFICGKLRVKPKLSSQLYRIKSPIALLYDLAHLNKEMVRLKRKNILANATVVKPHQISDRLA